MDVKLPPTVDEDMRNKPAVHELMRMGMTAYLGPAERRAAKLDYVNFYAHLHRVVDAQVGRLLDALGDPADPGSLRSRTVIFRCADHGEMGLSHGGLRQKAFNAYEETIHMPMVVSNPVLFPRPAETDALASLVDMMPTIATIAGADSPAPFRGRDLSPILADSACPSVVVRESSRLDPVLRHPKPAPSVQDADPLHLRRSPGSDRAPGRARSAEPDSRCADRKRKVRDLFRSQGKGAERVRAVRPRARSRRGNQPGRSNERRAPGRGSSAARAELGDRLETLMSANGTASPHVQAV